MPCLRASSCAVYRVLRAGGALSIAIPDAVSEVSHGTVCDTASCISVSKALPAKRTQSP